MLNKLYRWFMRRIGCSVKPYTDIQTIKFNLKKDKKDKRDYSLTVDETDDLPISVDLREHVSEIKQQGIIGSCHSHTMMTIYEMQLHMKYPSWEIPGSELFHYYNVRKLNDSWPRDEGQTIRDGIRSLRKDGFCPESLCPYSTAKYNKTPGIFAYGFAKNIYKRKFPVKSYYRCRSINSMKKALASGLPVALGVKIYRNFLSYNGGTYNAPSGRLLGGHSLTICGFQEFNKRFLVLNSWGSGQWGEKTKGYEGYCWLSYDYIKNNLIDAWTILI